MQCKACGYPDSHVVYTKNDDFKERIERRRECLRCGGRFTTHEKLRDAVKPGEEKFARPIRK